VEVGLDGVEQGLGEPAARPAVAGGNDVDPRSFMSFTYSRQSIASAVVPEPVAPRNLHARSRMAQLTPTTPTALFPTAPIVPATWVP